MGTTAHGIWYPDSGDAIAPLATKFSALAASVESALVVIDATEARGKPYISLQANGTAQSIAASTDTVINGNGTGWSVVEDTGDTAWITSTSGVSTTPFTIHKKGTYVCSCDITVSAAGSGINYLTVEVTGTAGVQYKRMVYTGLSKASASLAFRVPDGTNSIRYHLDQIGTAFTVTSATIEVQRVD